MIVRSTALTFPGESFGCGKAALGRTAGKIIQLSHRQHPANHNASSRLTIISKQYWVSREWQEVLSRSPIGVRRSRRSRRSAADRPRTFTIPFSFRVFRGPHCARIPMNAERQTVNAERLQAGAKNKKMAAPRSVKHQIKSRLNHERRRTANPMKS